jgi:hypothetical protein
VWGLVLDINDDTKLKALHRKGDGNCAAIQG